jgi:hypothetical protein
MTSLILDLILSAEEFEIRQVMGPVQTAFFDIPRLPLYRLAAEEVPRATSLRISLTRSQLLCAALSSTDG